MNKTLTTLAAGMMIVAGVAPKPVQAGEREWATAGKILTGVVVAGMLTEHCFARPAVKEIVYERPRCFPDDHAERWRHCRPPARVCLPPPRAPVYEIRKVVVIEQPRMEPIIQYLEDGRRIYQPPVRGCKAYLQVWSEVNNEWVSIREYPSIW